MHQIGGVDYWGVPDVVREVGCNPETARRYCDLLFPPVRVGAHRHLTQAEFAQVVEHLRAVESKRAGGRRGHYSRMHPLWFSRVAIENRRRGLRGPKSRRDGVAV